jgi:hypothetical protein
MEHYTLGVKNAIERGGSTAKIVKILETHKHAAPKGYGPCCVMGDHLVRALVCNRFDVLDWVWDERAAAGCADQYFMDVLFSAIRQPNTLALEWLRGKRPDVGSWRSNDAIVSIIVGGRHLRWFEDHCSLPNLLLNHLVALPITYFASRDHLMRFVSLACKLEHAPSQIELLKFATSFAVADAAERPSVKERTKIETEIIRAFAIHRETMRRWLTADSGKALAKLLDDADIVPRHYMRTVLRRIGFTASDFASAGVPP